MTVLSVLTVGKAEEMQAAFKYLKKDYDVVAVCLHGMGGIGKSTQALSIYKRFQAMERYSCCRVVLELGTKRAELPKFQREILQKVCKCEIPQFSDVQEGMEWMQKELPKRGMIFLYVDNVMNPGHLEQLLPCSKYFVRGSKILITTRNKDVSYDFKKLAIEHYECIEVNKLEKEVAKELFFSKMGRDCVGTSQEESIALETLEEEVLELCDGLPLALEIVSGYIANRAMDLDHWRDVVEKMREAVPLQGEADDDPLYSRLKFSITQLHRNFLRAFLDIVMFGIGRSREYAERLVGKVCFEDLLQRSLVQLATSDEDYRAAIRIHDVIYTMGKQMARDDHSELRIIGEKNFLNNRGSLQRTVGLSKIKIREADLLQQIPCLRVLDDVEIEVECEIRKLEHLKSVEISSSVSRPIHFSACSGLRQVIWSASANPDLEVFKGVKGLEALSIDSPDIDSREAVELHNVEVIESLTSLKELSLRGFTKLQMLSERISCLTALISLNLFGSRCLRFLPEGISCLIGLRVLDLSLCKSLQSLPEGISCLTGLTELRLDVCESLQSLPEGISCLTGLRVLHLYSCTSLQSLPEGISCLTGLTELHLAFCESLQSLPEGISCLTGLTELFVGYTKSLQSLPEGISCLTGSTKLDLRSCNSLQSLPEGISCLTGLTELLLGDCKSLQSLPEGISCLTGLRVLELSVCKSLQSLPEGISCLTGLRVLNLYWCESLQFLPEGISCLTGLTKLELRSCESLQLLPEGISCLTGLTELRLDVCESLQSLPEGISCLTGLRVLDLYGCKSLQFLPEGISCLTGLTELELRSCKSLQSLPEGISCLTGLRVLSLHGCKSLQFLPEGITCLTGLTELKLRGCESLQSRHRASFREFVCYLLAQNRLSL